ncbi:hypothetical protein HPB51_025142 [Rhipicephalus microplus]|uniref:DDE-1 domain-containing protein n=1 Tax=Rhipicephalus microplus TaxID=6941 RepID=A0A9J6DQY8_RHIMP|nr:hypothetical protein HPB51_025142 [Rhipicephalus microplus]
MDRAEPTNWANAKLYSGTNQDRSAPSDQHKINTASGKKQPGKDGDEKPTEAAAPPPAGNHRILYSSRFSVPTTNDKRPDELAAVNSVKLQKAVGRLSGHVHRQCPIRLQLDSTEVAAAQLMACPFQAGYGIVGKDVCSEAAVADKGGAVKWQNTDLQKALAAYDAADIFNFDELALFYCLLLNRTLAFKNEKCAGEKQAKNRISVTFGMNMTGSEKLPLMVICKYGNQRCFKGVRILSGIVYKRNKKA